MKTMTCKQLGGACDEKLQASTFEEMAEQSKNHGMNMVQKGDASHIAAMAAMMEKMQDSEAMKTWMQEKKQEFDSLLRRISIDMFNVCYVDFSTLTRMFCGSPTSLQ